jgi:hypothetical protein
MNNFLLFLHLLGLMIGSAGGLASGILMRRAMAMPADEARTVRSLGPMLAHVAGAGLVLMWVTGLIMVWSRWDGLGSLPSLFWVKFAFVVILTVASASIDVTYAQIRRTGNVALASRLPVLGPISGIAATLAVLFAVFAFG